LIFEQHARIGTIRLTIIARRIRRTLFQNVPIIEVR
jgi:hypothetical protein